MQGLKNTEYINQKNIEENNLLLFLLSESPLLLLYSLLYFSGLSPVSPGKIWFHLLFQQIIRSFFENGSIFPYISPIYFI